MKIGENLLKLRKIVEQELASAAHDLDHVERVFKLCQILAKSYAKVDYDVLIPAALLHDIARYKEDQDATGTIDHTVLGAKMAGEILLNLGYPEDKIKAVKYCIENHRFRGRGTPKTLEAMILFDADKLDVLGAIGVARSFVIAGEYGERIYSDTPVEEYIKDNLVNGVTKGRIKDISKHTPNLEYETKFRYVPAKLFTEKAKQLAKGRMEFMDLFFQRLQMEIQGEI